MESVKNITEQNKLVAAIKANDPKVLQMLYQENYGKIAAYIFKNSGSKPQAKDTYQECKSLLKLFYFEKKSMEEISELINITDASARNKKYRCMQKLKTIVANLKD